ncbi:phage tail tape measure protein [Rhodoligotrophos ferricapiens]|uniref:phage tail tape measure protein n=1 Tax=Rhodoligotrophos ferricapiens TaxID=3069264 RepID=UPI00315DA554
MNIQPLRVPITADISQLGPGFEKARGQIRLFSRDATAEAGKFAGMMKQSTNEVLGIVGRLGPGMTAGLAGFAGGFLAGGVMTGVTEGITLLRDSLVELSQTAADAKMAGVGVEAFQALQYAARLSKVGVDALTDGLKELQLRADEFIVTGKGPAAEAFARIGMSPQEIKERLKDPAEFLTEIMRRIYDLDKAAQIRILDELLGGTAGEQFIRFLERGRDGLADLQREARTTGNVLEKEIFDEAEKINAEFAAWATTIEMHAKRAAVGFLGTLRSIYRDVANVTDDEEGRADRRAELLEQEKFWTEELARAREQAANTGLDVDLKKAENTQVYLEGIRAAIQELDKLSEAEKKRNEPGPRQSQGGRIRYRFTGIDPDAQRQFDREREAAEREAQRQADKVEQNRQREKDAIDGVIESLQFEQEQLGRTAKEQELYNRLKQAGVTLSSEAGQQIEHEVDQLYAKQAAVDASKAALEKAKESQIAFNESIKDLSAYGIDAFTDLATGASSLTDVLDDLANMLLRASIQAALLGEGPLAGLFGTSQGGGILGALLPTVPSSMGNIIAGGRIIPHAKGGIINSPIAFPMRNGNIGTAAETAPEGIFPVKRMSNGELGIRGTVGAPSISVTYAPVIDARGADAGVEARLMRQLQQQRADFERQLPEMVKNAQRRSSLF